MGRAQQMGVGLMVLGMGLAGRADVRFVEHPATAPANTHYVGNREPLLASPLVKLPPGAVAPTGWLHEQLRRQADGFHGHLTEISQWLTKPGNAWLSPAGEGQHGWEEPPYWLKGFSNCAYVLGDERMLAETKIWIEGGLGQSKTRRLVRSR